MQEKENSTNPPTKITYCVTFLQQYVAQWRKGAVVGQLIKTFLQTQSADCKLSIDVSNIKI